MDNLIANNLTTETFVLEVGELKYHIYTDLTEDTIDIRVKRQYSPFTFEACFSMGNLQKMEKIFYMYDSLDAAYKMIKNKLHNKKTDIVETDEALTLKLVLEIDKHEKIISLLIPKNPEGNLALVVNDMSMIIQELVEKVKRLENPPHLKDSCIVKACEIDLIKSWLNELDSVEFELLYKGSIHGDTSQDFHSRCDNKGSTISLIETDTGRRFGGYTKLDWDSSNTMKGNDPQAFVFSLDHKRKFGLSLSSVIACFADKNVSFGDKDFEIANDYGKEASVSNFPAFFGVNDYFGDINPNTVLSGTRHFRPKNIEVFSVKFI
jgi:hypothetical protein